MTKNIFSILLLVILLFSCNEKKVLRKYERLPNGKLIFKRYYPNGKLEIETEVSKDSFYDGLFTSFHPNGAFESAQYMKHGNQDSICMWFYDTRMIEEIRCFDNGKLLGNQYLYDQNGHLLTYLFADYHGTNIYKREFDSTGKITKTIGEAAPQIEFAYEIPSIQKVGDSIGIKIYFASPPNCKVRLQTLMIDKSESPLKQFKPFDFSKDSVPTYEKGKCCLHKYYHYVCIKPGRFKLAVRLNIADTSALNTRIEKYDSFHEFEVKSPTDSLQ